MTVFSYCETIDDPTFKALEIKPKSGVIPPGRQSCRFCATQLQKIRRGKYDVRSAYCPVDLYSPDLRRKVRKFIDLLKIN